MGKEYEIKILEIDKPRILQILKKIKGKKIHKNMKYVRSVFHRCNSSDGYVRVRSENNKITMTSKTYKDPRFPQENEIEVLGDFSTAKQFLLSLNLSEKAYHETYREKWSVPIKNVHEIVFDTLPGLPTYMEIDCTSETALKKMIKLFGVDDDKYIKQYGSYGKTYFHYYGIPENVFNNKTPSLTFKRINKELKPKKNKSLLNSIHKKNKHL